MNVGSFGKWYWRISLFVPVIGGLIGSLLFGGGASIGLVLAYGAFLVAIPYAGFSVIMWMLAGHLRRLREVVVLAMVAPPVLAVLVLELFVLVDLVEVALGRQASTALGSSMALGIWSVIIGYAYVLPLLLIFVLVWLAFLRRPHKSG